MASTARDIVNAYGIQFALAQKIVAVSDALGLHDPAMLTNVIAFESQGFNPAITNPTGPGATGLIQFIPRVARELGTTTAKLREMSAIEQMDVVQRYFEIDRVRRGCERPERCSGARRPLETQLDVFMAVFFPPAIGEGLRFPFPARVTKANRGASGQISIKTPADYERLAFRNLGSKRLIPTPMPRKPSLEDPRILPRLS